jgi:IS1 family transposase
MNSTLAWARTFPPEASGGWTISFIERENRISGIHHSPNLRRELAHRDGTREIVGVYIGARDEAAARKLWQSLPSVYRQCAIAYTDFWAADAAVLPGKRHRAVGNETGKTGYIERFHNTLKQRVSQLVRKTLSFSNSLENHIGAIWYFIHHDNASLLV